MKRTGYTTLAVLFLCGGRADAAQYSEAMCAETNLVVATCACAAAYDDEVGAKNNADRLHRDVAVARHQRDVEYARCHPGAPGRHAGECSVAELRQADYVRALTETWEADYRAEKAKSRRMAACSSSPDMQAPAELGEDTKAWASACALARSTEAACNVVTHEEAPRGSDIILGFQLSDAAQLRFPRMDGVPSSLLANVGALGLVFQWGHLELMPEVFLMATRAGVTNQGQKVNETAAGLGGGAGLRIAVGWADAVSSGFYFSLFPSLAHWNIEASSGQKQTFAATVTEFGADLGFGYKIQLGDRMRLDIFAQAFRFGVRPTQQRTADFTTYPTLGLGIDLFPKGWRWSGK